MSLLVIKFKIRYINSSFSVVVCPSGTFPFGPVAYICLMKEDAGKTGRKPETVVLERICLPLLQGSRDHVRLGA